MLVIEGQADFKLHNKSAVAIGKFDGIHKGHQLLLDKVIEQKRKGLSAVVFTFDPSPAVLFTGVQEKELSTKEEKRHLFEQMGIDVLIEFPMTFQTAAIPAEVFVSKVLCEQMQTCYIAAGWDVSFGDKGKGDTKLLQEMSSKCGYEIEILEKVRDITGEEISSTLIRDAVKKGEMEKVNRLLGAPYSVTGIVAHGRKLGRTLGMPTVNLLPEKEKLLPPNGVYFSEVYYEDKCYKSITNIGYKPTVNEEKVLGVESYLYDFAQDIYGKEITVKLYAFKRPEMKFDGVESLKKQMASDIAEGKFYEI